MSALYEYCDMATSRANRWYTSSIPQFKAAYRRLTCFGGFVKKAEGKQLQVAGYKLQVFRSQAFLLPPDTSSHFFCLLHSAFCLPSVSLWQSSRCGQLAKKRVNWRE